MINTHSIQFRLILWYGALILLVSLAFGGFTYLEVERGLYADLTRTLQRRAGQIAAEILPQVGIQTPAAVAQEIQLAYAPEATDRFIRILRSDLSSFYISGTPGGGSFDPKSIVTPTVNQAVKKIDGLNGAPPLLVVTVPSQVGTESFLIEMGASTADIQSMLMRLARTLLIGLTFVIIVVSTGGYVLVRRSLRPVELLSATAEHLSFGTENKRLPVAHTGDAIERLGITLNQMLDRLHDAYHQASRFSADASHEIRTPLAIMRAELEGIVRRDVNEQGAIRERVGSVLEETERLSNITESLFALSRLDAGEAKMRDVRFDLTAMVGNTVDQMRLVADEKNILLLLDAPQPVSLRGDPDRLKQAVIDLLDNAIKYTPAAGRVTLRIFTEDAKAVFEIIDSGIGIPADALPYVFERFYRAETARSLQLPGAGLGLAIVKSICSAHGGAIHISSTEGQGTTCRVEFPISMA